MLWRASVSAGALHRRWNCGEIRSSSQLRRACIAPDSSTTACQRVSKGSPACVLLTRPRSSRSDARCSTAASTTPWTSRSSSGGTMPRIRTKPSRSRAARMPSCIPSRSTIIKVGVTMAGCGCASAADRPGVVGWGAGSAGSPLRGRSQIPRHRCTATGAPSARATCGCRGGCTSLAKVSVLEASVSAPLISPATRQGADMTVVGAGAGWGPRPDGVRHAQR